LPERPSEGHARYRLVPCGRIAAGPELRGGDMQQTTDDREPAADRDTIRPEYDFSRAVRGATAARYAEGANVVVIDPDVLDVFPDGLAVNEALRALAPVIRRGRRGGESAGRGGRGGRRTGPATCEVDR
jgi:hypothetical protein